ncbi:hypothetical protein IMZ48_28425 [Candidatus Bathyarchaeota archaeon]|nr:hypothetical protein [Candidatus Bathyarchaeota archaeon]
MPGGAIRAIPCAGCLAMLANWLPEDGEMPLCRDADEGTISPLYIGQISPHSSGWELC